MQKYFSKNAKKMVSPKPFSGKAIKRFQDNATRLEHSNVRNKNKSRKGD